jgi:polyvinyl alcohol dehydrogenase (cytochrome)
MLGHDARSNYNNTAETKISRSSVASLALKWEKDLGRNITSAPLQVGGRIYTAGDAIYCLDAASGDVLWRNGEFSTMGAMAYDDGVLYVHDPQSVLQALDASTGDKLWECPTAEQEGAAGFSSPIIAGDLVIVGGSTAQEVGNEKPTFRGSVTAVNRKTHEVEWRTYTVPEDQTGASVWSSVSVDVGTNRVFAATGNNYTEPGTDTSDAFLAFDFTTGVMDWTSQRFAGDVWSIFAAELGNPDADFGANPVVFEAEVDGVMTELLAGGQKSGDAHVVRRTDGTEVWKRKLGPGDAAGSKGIFNNTTWDGKHLLFAVNGATSDAPGSEPVAEGAVNPAVIFAVDPASGDIVWERQISGQVMAPITVANGVGFVGADKKLEAFDTNTGERLFEYPVDATIACSATVSNGRVAIGSGLSWLFGTPGSKLTVLELPE